MPSLPQTIKFKSHTKPEEKNMPHRSPWDFWWSGSGLLYCRWSLYRGTSCPSIPVVEKWAWFSRSRNDKRYDAAIGENHDREGRKNYTDKSDPVREHDCIWCMACVTVCPTQAIKVDEANLKVHKTTAAEITS